MTPADPKSALRREERTSRWAPVCRHNDKKIVRCMRIKDLQTMELPTIPVVVEFEARPVRVHGESAPVLADELELTEKELFDTRELYFEEVRLAKVLADENVKLERDHAHLNECYWSIISDNHRLRDRLKSERDRIESREFAREKRDRWVGVALGVAFLLGGYFGFILGCAT